MLISRRLILAIFSVLLLALIAGALPQTVQAQTTTIQATVVWVNGPKPTIWLKLYRQVEGGVAEEVPAAEAPVKEITTALTTVSWTEITTHDPTPLPYSFSVKQGTWNADTSTFTEAVPTNYTPALSTDGLTITNTYVIPTSGSATATKVWDNGPAIKPTIWFKLYRKNSAVATQEVPGAEVKELPNGTTTVTWNNLEETDLAGNVYSFSVREGTWNAGTSTFTEGSPQYFSTTYSADGLTVTNTLVPEVTATKVWVNGPALKPTVWFKLFRELEGGAAEEVPIAEAPIKPLPNNTTSVTWTGLTVQTLTGKFYTFSVHEVTEAGVDFTPTNYAKLESGLTVTNTYVIPQTGTATATKVWSFGPAQKPNVWFKLYRKTATGAEAAVPGAEVKQVPTTGTPLQVSWTGLDATDLAGNTYAFSVKEGVWVASTSTFTPGTPTNYTAVTSTDGLTITNSYVSPKIDVTGTKIWSGGPVTKPNIQIQLYQNGNALGSPVTFTNGKTTNVWTVDQTASNGATYQYSINEVAVPAYYSKYVNGMTVTNTYTGTLPYTGDNTNNARWLVLLLGFAALLPLVSWLDLKLLTRRRG